MVTLRRIEQGDNLELAQIIRTSLEDLGYALEGTVYTDPNTDRMFSCYQSVGTAYWIAEENGKLIGGSGIGRLECEGEVCEVCELQRMFLTSDSRGKGIGWMLMKNCLEFAKQSGYERIYLETFPKMPGALKLYERSGFRYIGQSLGKTGHFSCSVFMIRDL